METVVSKEDGETFFIQKEDAIIGDAPNRRTIINGSEEKYIKISEPTYGEIDTKLQR